MKLCLDGSPRWPCLVLGVALAAAGRAPAEEAGGLAEALGQGRATLSLRYRYEDVADDAVGEKHARASTLRTVLGYRTKSWKGLSVMLEAENVAALGNDLYNNAGAGDRDNGVRDRPVVADPDGTEINQAWLELGRGSAALRLGRQEVLLGDQRYVGAVGWRQNHQSLDAFTLTGGPWRRLSLFYGYVDSVQRVDYGEHPMAGHLLNVSLAGERIGKLTLYGYWLDYENPGQLGLSTRTVGAEWAGSWKASETVDLLWELEYARQDELGDNPAAIDAGYSFLMLGGDFGKLTARLGLETLEGAPGKGAFRTPLATLHKFNGWADKFLTTPADGLEDLYLQLSGAAGPWRWLVAFHDFSADTGSAGYGEELDFQLLYRAPWKQGFGFKGALYDAEAFARDTNKWWVFTTYEI